MPLIDLPFLARAAVAIFLSAVVALAFAMWHGVPANVAYHAAVDAEVAARLGERLSLEEVEKMQQKYAPLRDSKATGIHMAQRATSLTTVVSTLLWFLVFRGNRQNTLSLIILTAAIVLLQMPMGLISSFTGAAWLLASILGTRADPRPETKQP